MTTKWFRHRWLVVCDDYMKSHPTRKAAREDARRLNDHPSNEDIRRFGPYLNVTGIARVIDLGNPDYDRQQEGRPAYLFEEDDGDYW
ncbi:hypothetical protein IRY61_05020 [Candidatus Saccharibacteria bacterium]|nr:hypothetical protein [Candidatus Saccharibacteria bacterium]